MKNNFIKCSLVTFIALIIPYSASAKDLSKEGYKGQIRLLKECPGDIQVADKDEFGGAIATALLSFAVKKGASLLGQKLKESSEEKIIETLHRGDYFYGLKVETDEKTAGGNTIEYVKSAKYSMKYGCIIIVTPPKTNKSSAIFKNSSDSNGNWWPGYFGVQRSKASNKVLLTEAVNDSPEMAKKLQAEISKLGYDDYLPSSVMVLDIEPSKQDAKFRLVPRYFAVPHSPREKKVDSNTRDFAFEIKMTTGGEKPFAQSMLPLKRVKLDKPFSRKLNGDKKIDMDAPLLTSQWMSIPENDSDAVAKIATLIKSTKLKADAESISKLQRGNIDTLSVKGSYASRNLVQANGTSACSVLPNDLSGIAGKLDTDRKLLAQRLTVKNSGYEQDVIMLDEVAGYLKTCKLIETYDKQVTSFENLSKTKSKYDAVPFDIHVTIKEFRKKPLAAFVASALSDEGVQTALTSETLDLIDPATRKKNAKADATALATAQKSLDDAITLANIAIQEYNNESDAAKKAVLLLKADQAKRVANRAAQSLDGVTVPFPEAGFYIQ